jgi:anion-transporting  ArsA/GET3 family ATPase
LPSLFDKRLLIFSGKGGAGKSTAAAAAAVAAARRGKRVLIVEIGEQERIPSLFGRTKAGYAGAPIYTSRTPGIPAIWSMCLTARQALHEFARRSVKFEVVSTAVFENRAMRSFTAAAPGLDELVIMGKIEALQREALVSSASPPFDVMVFDAPATGHGLAFFKVPRTAMSMVRVGPLRAKAERMWTLLADPQRTALNIVSLPEEMSVSESIDLHAAADALGLPRGKLVVNAVYPDLLDGDPGKADALRGIRDRLMRSPSRSHPADAATRVAQAVLDRAASAVAVRSAQDEMIAKLAAALPQERIVLPYVFPPHHVPDIIETLADAFAGF